MKKTLMIIILAMLAFACKKTILNVSDYAPIEGRIDDIRIEEGIAVHSVNLQETFTIEGQDNRILQHSVIANSNPSLVSTEVDGDRLLLKIRLGLTGDATLTLRSSSPTVFKETTFTLTVTPVEAATALNRARSFFRDGDYETARGYFTLVTRKGSTLLYAEAYMGSGFSKMRLSGDDLGYGDLIRSLAFDNNNNDALAGLSLLEYAQKQNYAEAIRHGERLLSRDAQFRFSLDSTLDKDDIRLNIALSQFALGRYEECLSSILRLNPAFGARAGDNDFTDALLQELNRLTRIYG